MSISPVLFFCQMITPMRQLRIYCAGVWHNFVIAVIALVVLFSMPWVLLPFYQLGAGVAIMDVQEVRFNAVMMHCGCSHWVLLSWMYGTVKYHYLLLVSCMRWVFRGWLIVISFDYPLTVSAWILCNVQTCSKVILAYCAMRCPRI